MSKTKSEQPLEPSSPVVLSANCIADGKFIPAGSETPFTEETLPEHLRQYLATGQENFYHPSDRNIYSGQPPAPDVGFVYQGVSSGQWVRRQASQAAGAAQEQLYAEEQAEAEQQLPVETQQALQDQHDQRIALLKARGSYVQRLTDATYEAAQAEAAAQESQFFVKRGGERFKTPNFGLAKHAS
jgi:hypothetical protein